MDHSPFSGPGEQHRSLLDFKRASRDAIAQMPEELSDVWFKEDFQATKRADRLDILPLLYEFQDDFVQTPFLHYELAFAESWRRPTFDARLYEARQWIGNYASGVFFLYNAAEQLCYIGSGFVGELGQRILDERHRDYRWFTDVLLFDCGWLHFALAFEALAISRLQPLHNEHGKDLWFPPPPPFERIWKKAKSHG